MFTVRSMSPFSEFDASATQAARAMQAGLTDKLRSPHKIRSTVPEREQSLTVWGLCAQHLLSHTLSALRSKKDILIAMVFTIP